jgi:hypothetical protein
MGEQRNCRDVAAVGIDRVNDNEGLYRRRLESSFRQCCCPIRLVIEASRAICVRKLCLTNGLGADFIRSAG